jgi:hypothetical protein
MSGGWLTGIILFYKIDGDSWWVVILERWESHEWKMGRPSGALQPMT